MADGQPRIQTMHAGSLPRPADLYEMILAKEGGSSPIRTSLPLASERP